MIWSFGRAVVYLKRLSVAAESLAESQSELARLARMEYSLNHPSRGEIKQAEFGIADVTEDWNKRWEIEHPQEVEE